METLVDFWQQKKVFVTGHTGFKGSWLSSWLLSLGARLTGYALPPTTNPSLFEGARLAEQMDSHFGDIDDVDTLNQAVSKAKPDILFHLAAQPLVRDSYKDPRGTFQTNVMGTLHVLEAARASRVRVVVVITTDKCYENKEWLWPYRENDELGGHDPYSASKACAEILSSSYRRSFCFDGKGPLIATARAGNVIGGGDWARERLVPDIVRAFSAGQSPNIRNPLAVRPWQHVLEPLAGYLKLAQSLWEEGEAFAEAWNFGPAESDCRTVKEVVGLMAGYWGVKEQWFPQGGTHPHEASLLKLDSSKAIHRLGWTPRWELETTLEKTTMFYKRVYEGECMDTLLRKQIEHYENS